MSLIPFLYNFPIASEAQSVIQWKNDFRRALEREPLENAMGFFERAHREWEHMDIAKIVLAQIEEEYASFPFHNIPQEANDFKQWTIKVRQAALNVPRDRFDYFYQRALNEWTIKSKLKGRQFFQSLIAEYRASSKPFHSSLPAIFFHNFLEKLTPKELADFQIFNKFSYLEGSSDALWKRFLVEDVMIPRGKTAKAFFIERPEFRKPNFLRVDRRGILYADALDADVRRVQNDSNNMAKRALALFSKIPRFNTHPHCKKKIIEFICDPNNEMSLFLLQVEGNPLSNNIEFMENLSKYLERSTTTLGLDLFIVALSNSKCQTVLTDHPELMTLVWQLVEKKGFPPNAKQQFFSAFMRSDVLYILREKDFREHLEKAIIIHGYEDAKLFLVNIACLQACELRNAKYFRETIWQVIEAQSFLHLHILISHLSMKGHPLISKDIFLRALFNALLSKYFNYDQAVNVINLFIQPEMLALANNEHVVKLIITAASRNSATDEKLVRLSQLLSSAECVPKLPNKKWIELINYKLLSEGVDKTIEYLSENLKANPAALFSSPAPSHTTSNSTQPNSPRTDNSSRKGNSTP